MIRPTAFLTILACAAAFVRADVPGVLEHTALDVADPVATSDWWVENLGFTVTMRKTDATHTTFVADASGRVAIEFYRAKTQPKAPDYARQDPLTLHFGFVSEDVDADVARLTKKGATLVVREKAPGFDGAMMRDPSGIPIQFVRRAKSVLAPPARTARILWARTICRERGKYIGWPTVCRLKNGDLLAVFSGDRHEHICPWGKVQMVRSKDGGETWSAPVTIADTRLDDRDAGIAQMPDGEVIVTWFTSTCWTQKCFIDTIPDWKRHLDTFTPEDLRKGSGDFLIRSRDNGETWSKPEKLSVYAQAPHGPILLRNGSLLEIGRIAEDNPNASSANSGQRTIVNVTRSDDSGRTWKMLCPRIPDANGEGNANWIFHEPHVAELADGTLVGMVRYHGVDDALSKPGNGYMRTTFSKDGGRTWTPMAKTPLLGMPPHLLPLKDGRLLCVYGRRLRNPGFGEFACLSSDGGKTWDVANEICLHPGFDGDLGYPASCELPNGDILTVFYQKEKPTEKTVLMAVKWRPPALGTGSAM